MHGYQLLHLYKALIWKYYNLSSQTLIPILANDSRIATPVGMGG